MSSEEATDLVFPISEVLLPSGLFCKTENMSNPRERIAMSCTSNVLAIKLKNCVLRIEISIKVDFQVVVVQLSALKDHCSGLSFKANSWFCTDDRGKLFCLLVCFCFNCDRMLK